MKYLIKTNDYSALSNASYNRVVFDETADSVYIKGGGVKTIAPSQSVACDICFYDKQKDKVVIVSQNDWSIENCPTEKYTPIGVVVVPGNHNVYGDGSCGVMSLKEMNYSTPDTGSTSYQYMYWGHYGSEITGLPNLNQTPTGNQANGLPTGQTNGSPTGQTSRAYLPSDKFSGTQCAHDTDAYYNSSPYAPSPYLTDGSRNPGYYQTTSPSSINNCLADFDGRGNSEILWDHARAQGDWKTASTITNKSGYYYLPAACCCWRYHTEGTQQGDWYLPAMGELGYIMPPFNKINVAITKMLNAYGESVGVQLNTSSYYWSSSDYSYAYARYLYMYNGLVNSNFKNLSNYVRAFLRVGSGGVVSG